ncbi:hypothetical protein, partial [Streptomyces uncialis]|uniref:hypothetical protein n=1 Tax=Streptomyces uncialis TaxID=1048205 RepID=UPI0034007062
MVRPSPDPSAAGLLGGARTSPAVGAGAVRVDDDQSVLVHQRLQPRLGREAGLHGAQGEFLIR